MGGGSRERRGGASEVAEVREEEGGRSEDQVGVEGV